MIPEISKLKTLYQQLDHQQAAGEDVVADLKKEINNLELTYLKEYVFPQVAKFLASKINGLRCEVDSNFQFDGEENVNYSFCTSGSMLFVKDSIKVKSDIEISDLKDLHVKSLQTSIKNSTVESTSLLPSIRLVDYSEKAFAVYGDTKPYAEIFKKKGGYFNAHLRDGAGWVFSKKHENEIRVLLEDELKDSTISLLTFSNLESPKEEANSPVSSTPVKESRELKCTLKGFRTYLSTKKSKNGRIFSPSSINVYSTATRSNYMRTKVLKYHHTGNIYNITDPAIISNLYDDIQKDFLQKKTSSSYTQAVRQYWDFVVDYIASNE